MALKIEPFDPRKHDYKRFTCGAPPQDRFIQRFAKQHSRKSLSRTHVLIDDENATAMIGYITLSACHVAFSDLDPADAKRFPRYPVPGVRLCQLAVSRDYRGKGYGDLLIAEAANRARNVRDDVGVALLVVDVQDNDRKLRRYYESFGFVACADAPGTLYLNLGKAGT